MKSSEFKILVMPYSERLYRMAFRMMGNREEAEDMVQEAYVKLWKMRNELPSYNSIEALAIRITRNLCLDGLRKRKTGLEAYKSQEVQKIEFDMNPHETLENKEDAEMMHRLINTLPEPQRSLIHLRHIEGKEYDEIATMVNMNVNAIRVSISRARKQMREILEKQYSSWKV